MLKVGKSEEIPSLNVQDEGIKVEEDVVEIFGLRGRLSIWGQIEAHIR